MTKKRFWSKNCLYFSRWNRKGYAIFASLGKEIRILALAIEICEKALEKSSLKGVIVNLSKVSVETVRKIKIKEILEIGRKQGETNIPPRERVACRETEWIKRGRVYLVVGQVYLFIIL